MDLATPPTSPSLWQRAGSPTIGLSASVVVTGARRYVSDLRRPGMLYGIVLHPPTYGARLVEADLEAARKRPGVHVVRDGDFVSVVAPSPAEAAFALASIQPIWRSNESPGEPENRRVSTDPPGRRRRLGPGRKYRRRCPSGPRSGTGRSGGDLSNRLYCPRPARNPLRGRRMGRVPVTAWVGTQTPFRVRDEVAAALAVSTDDVRVVVPPTVSGFGGKHGGVIAVAAARLARAVGQPVRVAFTREEEFRFGYFRPMAVIDVRAGAEQDGRLTAWVFHNVNAGSAALFAPYRIPNQKVDNQLSRSPLPQGSYRSLAAATNNFARESAIDETRRSARRRSPRNPRDESPGRSFRHRPPARGRSGGMVDAGSEIRARGSAWPSGWKRAAAWRPSRK